MGFNDRLEEYNNIGLGSVPDKYICANHLKISTLNGFIRRSSKSGDCSYCNTAKKVISFSMLMEFIMKTVNFFFEDAGNYQPYETKAGGYLWGGKYEHQEIIQDFLQIDADPFEIVTDIENSLDYSKYWTRYYDFYNSTADDYTDKWSFFCQTVKHKTRYLFEHSSNNRDDLIGETNPTDTLNDIAYLIKKKKLYTTLNKNTEILRGQQHSLYEKSECKNTSRLVSPPQKFATAANRFSPSGISMFYGAFDSKTIIREIYKPEKGRKHLTIGTFELKKDVRLIDLTKIPSIPNVFEHRRLNSSYYDITFLKQLVNNISQPVPEDKTYDIEYVPTQIITEFFKYSFNQKLKVPIQGILYPSAANKGKKCVVLFWDHESSYNKLELKSTKYYRSPK